MCIKYPYNLSYIWVAVCSKVHFLRTFSGTAEISIVRVKNLQVADVFWEESAAFLASKKQIFPSKRDFLALNISTIDYWHITCKELKQGGNVRKIFGQSVAGIFQHHRSPVTNCGMGFEVKE